MTSDMVTEKTWDGPSTPVLANHMHITPYKDLQMMDLHTRQFMHFSLEEVLSFQMAAKSGSSVLMPWTLEESVNY